MAAEQGKVDPMHQFTIEPIFGTDHWSIAGYNIAFTNSSLFMLVVFMAITALMVLATNGRHIVPTRLQAAAEMAYEFVASGAGDEITLRWNREALEKIALWPRVLNDVSKLDTHVTLFGNELAFPILLAPTAFHRAVHPEGEAATARGAGAAGRQGRQYGHAAPIPGLHRPTQGARHDIHHHPPSSFLDRPRGRGCRRCQIGRAHV